MAPLQKQLQKISLATGMDAKTDPVELGAGKMTDVIDAVYDKPGALTRRNGSEAVRGSEYNIAQKGQLWQLGSTVGISTAEETVFAATATPLSTKLGSGEISVTPGLGGLVEAFDSFALPGYTRWSIDAHGDSTFLVGYVSWSSGTQTRFLTLYRSDKSIVRQDITCDCAVWVPGTGYVLAQGTTLSLLQETGALSVLPGSLPAASFYSDVDVSLLLGGPGELFFVGCNAVPDLIVARYSLASHTVTASSTTAIGGGSLQSPPHIYLSTSNQYGLVLVDYAGYVIAAGGVNVIGNINVVAGFTDLLYTAIADPGQANSWVVLGFSPFAGGSAHSVVLVSRRWSVVLGSPTYIGDYGAPKYIENRNAGSLGDLLITDSRLLQFNFPVRPIWANNGPQVWLSIDDGIAPRYVRFQLLTSTWTGGAMFIGEALPTVIARNRDPTSTSIRWMPARRTTVTGGLCPLFSVQSGDPYGLVGQLSIRLVRLTDITSPAAAPDVLVDRQALLIAGAGPRTWSGSEEYEQGFFASPSKRALVYTGAAPGGGDPVRTFTYSMVFVSENNLGQVERSAPSPDSTISQQFAPGGGVTLSIPASMSRRNASKTFVEIYRTTYVLGIATSAKYLLVTVPVANMSVPASQTYFDGTAIDISANQVLYSQSELPADPPPPLKQLVRWQDRVVGVDASQPGLLWFSKPDEAGVATEWNADTTLQVSTEDVLIAPLDDKLIIFEANKISYITGQGPDATGQGEFSQLYIITQGEGTTNRQAIVRTPEGIWYQGKSGLRMINRGGGDVQAGILVDPYTQGNNIIASYFSPTQNKIFWVTDGQGRSRITYPNTLVLDTSVQQWSRLTNYFCDSMLYGTLQGPNDSAPQMRLYRFGSQMAFTNFVSNALVGDLGPNLSDPDAALADFNDFSPGIQVTTGWLPTAPTGQGLGRLYRVGVDGTWLSKHRVTLTANQNYGRNSMSTFADFVGSAPPNEQVRWRVPVQKCEAVQLIIGIPGAFYNPSADITQPVNAGARLNSLVLEYGVLPGLQRLPAGQSV